MADKIDWVVITGNTNKEIGAIGFLDNQAVVVAAFYDDYDGNKDGKVSFGEWAVGKLSPIGLKKMGITEVAWQARYNEDVVLRDSDFNSIAVNMFLTFAKGLVADGIYAAYFSQAVSMVAAPIAGRLTSNFVASFVIKKGMEASVKRLYGAAVK